MASEQERREAEAKILLGLRKTSLSSDQLGQALQAVMQSLFPELEAERNPKRKRRCGASLPHPNADDGWRWCGLSAGHTEPHMDVEDNLYAWEDETIVTVTTVEEIRAIPDHVHDFSGDDRTCNRDLECMLTWGEYKAQDRRWTNGH